MIVISSKSRYAVLALSELAKHAGEGPVPISELAQSREIPVQFLEQLFATLRRSGLLCSQRGVKGGYTFCKSAEDMTVLEVVETLDGPVGADATGASAVFTDAATRLRDYLGSISIADVSEGEAEATPNMYYI